MNGMINLPIDGEQRIKALRNFANYKHSLNLSSKKFVNSSAVFQKTVLDMTNNLISKDMKRINRSEHMVELGCLSYWWTNEKEHSEEHSFPFVTISHILCKTTQFSVWICCPLFHKPSIQHHNARQNLHIHYTVLGEMNRGQFALLLPRLNCIYPWFLQLHIGIICYSWISTSLSNSICWVNVCSIFTTSANRRSVYPFR